MNGDYVTYCESSGVEHIPKETQKFIGKNHITTNIYINTSKSFRNVWIVLNWIY